VTLDINTITSEASERIVDQLNDEHEYHIPENDHRDSGEETDSEVQESGNEVLESIEESSEPMDSKVQAAEPPTNDIIVDEIGETKSSEPCEVSDLIVPILTENRTESEPVDTELVTLANTAVNAETAVPKESLEEDEISSVSAAGRQRKPSQRLLDSYVMRGNTYMRHFAKVYRVSMGKALKSDRAEESKEAAVEEIKNMLQYKVGHYVKVDDIPFDKRRNIISSFMFLKHKEDSDGNITRTKARLVGNGANQKSHMYDLVSSASLFILLNIATYFKTMLCSFDIKGAFLNAQFGESDEVTYIRLNREVTKIWIAIDPSAERFVDHKGELVLELDKFIYGLKQSPRKFQEHLVTTLKALGYKQLEQDECLFIKWVKGSFSLLSLHVDDILQACTSRGLFVELKDG
jgi:hypothetical protein